MYSILVIFVITTVLDQVHILHWMIEYYWINVHHTSPNLTFHWVYITTTDSHANTIVPDCTSKSKTFSLCFINRAKNPAINFALTKVIKKQSCLCQSSYLYCAYTASQYLIGLLGVLFMHMTFSWVLSNVWFLIAAIQLLLHESSKCLIAKPTQLHTIIFATIKVCMWYEISDQPVAVINQLPLLFCRRSCRSLKGQQKIATSHTGLDEI
jgi:hypothetical protein